MTRRTSLRARPVACAPVVALAGLVPGPELALGLASVATLALTGHEQVLVLRAVERQVSHYQGRRQGVVGAVLHLSDPLSGLLFEDETPSPSCGDGREVTLPGADEVRAALVLTRRGANLLCDMAADLAARMPQVQAAMVAGRLDQPRAVIFSHWTSDLCDRHAAAIVAALLPVAPTLTTAQLIAAIQRAAIELDPEWARRRYSNSLKARDVKGIIHTDGTAELSGTHLPADGVAAACDRIDALARRVKDAGHPGLLRHIRADIFLGRNSHYVGMSDEQLFTHLMSSAPDPGPESEGGDDDGEDGGGSGGGWDEGPDLPDSPAPAGAAAGADSIVDDNVQAADVGGGRGKGLRLLAGLATIASCDQRPGELLGYGHLIAPLARNMAGAPHASWYYALTTPDGAPLAVGLIRRRPTTEVAANPTLGAGRVEVWLQLTPEELQRLVHAPPPGWETIITDLAGRQPAGAPNGDPRRRIPGEMLRRWINIRDRYCSFPGCRIAAHRTQVDHTHDYALGGQTVDRNLGSACGADHPLKDKGWHLRQSRPGVFVWTSPLGHQYTRTLPPGPEHAFAPMPDPTRPDEDDFLIYTSDTWDGPDSCRTICDPPLLPTPPRAAPKPAPHPPQEGDEIPF